MKLYFYNTFYFSEFLDLFGFFKIFLVCWVLIYLLLTVAIFTVFERKLLAAGQRRLGPHVVGYAGILQPFADAFKLLAKQFLIPTSSSRNSFIWAPAVVLVSSFSGWFFIPFSSYESLVFNGLSLFFILGLSSIGALGILLTGWSGGSRYSVLGGLRAAAQLISYEIVFGFLFFPIVLEVGSANLVSIMADQDIWFCFVYPFLFIIFLILILAETNRAPFDLPEAESELVAGFNVEYSSAGFTVLFLAEYNSMLLMSALGAVIFLGGFGVYNSGFIFSLKVIFFCFFIVAIRGILPRYRYDQLMRISWGPFLVLVTFGVILVSIKSLYFPNHISQTYSMVYDKHYYELADYSVFSIPHEEISVFDPFFYFYNSNTIKKLVLAGWRFMFCCGTLNGGFAYYVSAITPEGYYIKFGDLPELADFIMTFLRMAAFLDFELTFLERHIVWTYCLDQ